MDYPEITTELRVDVGVLKGDVNTLTRLCEKMDMVIEKLVEHQDVIINQIYQDMDRRKADTNADVKEIHSRITTVNREISDELKSTEMRIMTEIKNLRQELLDYNSKEDSEIQRILKWKWTIVGGIMVFSWLTSHPQFVRMILPF